MAEEQPKNMFEETEALDIDDADSNDDATVMQQVKQPVKKALVNTDEIEIGGLSSVEKLEIMLKPEDKDKVFTIKTAEITNPKYKDAEGNKIPMIVPEQGGQPHYKSKFKLTFVNSNYGAYVPNIKWYLNDVHGKKVLQPWFAIDKLSEEDLENPLVSQVSKMYYKYCVKNKIEVGKLTREKFRESLIGMQVTLKQFKGTNPKTKQTGYTILIDKFV